jgi:DNA-binding IclR family transcriptional regulator
LLYICIYQISTTNKTQYQKDLAKVKRDGYALEWVEEQTEQICLAAVGQNPMAKKYVKIDF